MGFFDSFMKAFNESEEKEYNRLENVGAGYKNSLEIQQEYYVKINSYSDEKLLRLVRSSTTSSDNRQLIKQILENRNYIFNKDGTIDRG